MNYLQQKERALISVHQGSIPSGYKQVEYLESTGTQYIDTLISPTNETGMSLTFSNISITGDSNFCGCRIFGGARYMFNYNNRKLGYGFNSYVNTNIDFPQIKATLELNMFNNRKFVYGDYVIDINNTLPSGLPSIIYFGQKSDIKVLLYSYRVYSFKISSANTLVRDFIPCLDNNNRPCMYDIVSKQTFYNQGTGEFLYGEVIN